MQEYAVVTRPINKKMMEVYQAMDTGNKELYDSISKELSALSIQKDSIDIEFIQNHLDSYFTPTLYLMKMSRMTLDEMKDAYEAFTPEVQASATEMKAEIDALEAIMPGKPAPDLIGVNHKGEPEKLSDLKGKVVLVDFWATWCGPCRASLPHVYEVYKKYHDKGFEVFCVGDNDSDPENWAKFINESKDGMSNYHHILRGLKVVKDANGKTIDYDRTNDQSDKYAVHYLPTKYLIAADGTIIGKIDTDEELDIKLAEIFN